MRVLEEKEIERVGEQTPVNVDVRIVSATHRDLEALVRQGRFREDLFFRINVFPLKCPALRERREDIPAIVQHFIRKNAERSAKKILGLTPEALEKLSRYQWPGMCANCATPIEYAFVLCASGGIGAIICRQKFYRIPRSGRRPKASNLPGWKRKAELIEILRRVGGNQSEAARLLNVSRVTIWKTYQALPALI